MVPVPSVERRGSRRCLAGGITSEGNMNQFTHVARRLAAGAVVALAMTVGLTTLTAAGSSAAVTTSKSVVGKSDLGKITSEVVGKTSTGDKVGGSFTPIKVIERDG